MSLGPTSGSVLTAQSLKPSLDSVSPSPSVPPPFIPFLSLSKINIKQNLGDLEILSKALLQSKEQKENNREVRGLCKLRHSRGSFPDLISFSICLFTTRTAWWVILLELYADRFWEKEPEFNGFRRQERLASVSPGIK